MTFDQALKEMYAGKIMQRAGKAKSAMASRCLELLRMNGEDAMFLLEDIVADDYVAASLLVVKARRLVQRSGIRGGYYMLNDTDLFPTKGGLLKWRPRAGCVGGRRWESIVAIFPRWCYSVTIQERELFPISYCFPDENTGEVGEPSIYLEGRHGSLSEAMAAVQTWRDNGFAPESLIQ